mgnify:CR=1 FL=1
MPNFVCKRSLNTVDSDSGCRQVEKIRYSQAVRLSWERQYFLPKQLQLREVAEIFVGWFPYYLSRLKTFGHAR